MIASLHGTLLEQYGEQLVLDVSGVGYLVTVSAAVLGRQLKVGDTIRLTIFTDVKENGISLFGFNDSIEREVFLLLKKVKGIGPKLALAVLSFLGAEGVLGAVGRGDISRLQQVPGIGRKSAERLVVELREYVGELAFDRERIGATSKSNGTVSATAEDALMALEKLGFSKDRARTAVESALKLTASGVSDPGELLRLSLGQLM